MHLIRKVKNYLYHDTYVLIVLHLLCTKKFNKREFISLSSYFHLYNITLSISYQLFRLLGYFLMLQLLKDSCSEFQDTDDADLDNVAVFFFFFLPR